MAIAIDELEFQENSEDTGLNYRRVVAGQTTEQPRPMKLSSEPYNKQPINLERSIFRGKS